MSKPKVLIQLDSDPHPSVFDAMVAIDSGVDQLLQYGGVEPVHVRGLVHGAMFTRGPGQLHNTAIFIGGSDVARGEQLLDQVTRSFFGPLRVSVMLDANGANTTAAAAVVAGGSHLDLASAKSLVMAGTGSVGRRVAQMLAQAGGHVTIASRSKQRAAEVAGMVSSRVSDAKVEAAEYTGVEQIRSLVAGAQLVVCAGAAGIELIPAVAWQDLDPSDGPRVLVDLNAVPPLGISGAEVNYRGAELHGAIVYGAIGVGGLKMKIHRAAIARLFESNDQVLDAADVLAIGRAMVSAETPPRS